MTCVENVTETTRSDIQDRPSTRKLPINLKEPLASMFRLDLALLACFTVTWTKNPVIERHTTTKIYAHFVSSDE
jgi:hypothetical protein